MTADVDIAILGAGCAGLSLATALSDAQAGGSVVLLDARTRYVRDRSWCFWNTEDHPFIPAITHSWNSWRVRHGAVLARKSSHTYRYCHIAADDFYRFARERIDRTPSQVLRLGVSVRSVATEGNGLVAIETSEGRLLARQVFDGRTIEPAETKPALLQRFVGWHVRTATPVFDPETVELMHFLPCAVEGRTRFLYVLPFSRTEALVEMTYLDAPGLAEPEYHADLEGWLREQTTSWDVLYREKGTLPMGTPARTTYPAGVHAIGIRGGRIKPSSGYAFLRIQRHSRAIAHAIKAGGLPPHSAEPQLYNVMDTVFLRALRQAPATVPALFLRMFAANTADAMVRFLSEASHPAEMLRVAWSLPKLPMVRAAMASAW